MTRIPELERELLAAAHRRYGTAPARRRRPVPTWLRPRLLLPVAALLLTVVVAGNALRDGGQPEVEVPAARYHPSTTPTIDELLRGPLRGLVGRSVVDASVPPVSMTVGSGRERWVVAVYSGRAGNVCVATVPEIRSKRRHGGTSCSPAVSVAMSATGRDSALGGVMTGTGRLLFGMVAEDAREVRVGGRVPRRAALSAGVFERPLTESEQRTARENGHPDLRRVRLRVYAAAYTPRELRPALPIAEQDRRVTYADGETRSFGAP